MEQENQPNGINSDNLRVFQMAKQSPGNTIKAMLVLKNISQKEIAVKNGIWPTDLCKVIQGKRNTPKIREVLAKELGIPVSWLFEELDRKQQKPPAYVGPSF